MALYKNSKYLKKGEGTLFDQEYSPGEDVPHSGIYICVNCNQEAACNKDDPFPPQNHHQHTGKTPIKWKLIVGTS